ncbi:MAG: hypothetical protein QOF37_466, partial [Thermoleophilaceae bacterium]|nr:hypothetical protein [Thermoleophilaceae bacterium]
MTKSAARRSGAAIAAMVILGVGFPAGAPAGFDTLSTVSVDAAGDGTANGISGSASGSSDGRYVAFESQAPADDVVSGATDSNFDADVFLRDRSGSGSTTLVSHAVGSLTTAGDTTSTKPVVSANGRYVAFLSQATDIVSPAVTDGLDHVYLYDRLNPGSTVLVDHTSSDPDVAGDRVAGQVWSVTNDG